ncbi:hypothetical protein [Rugosimonospora africana]|nr:hypothetical protein [Rugosimonospora africana]
MSRHPGEVETVITAKIDEDFTRATADSALAAASARFGHTTATRVGALTRHPAYNKARGFNGDDIAYLPAIRSFFTDVGISPLIEVWAGHASATLGRHLAGAGFYAAEVNATLRATASGSSVPALETEPEIRELSNGEDDSIYLETLFDGYGLNSETASAQRAMMAIEHRSPRLRRYLAYVDDRPAAAAALYTTPQAAYFAGAATIPAMRNRGCQSALIRRRLRDTRAGQVVVTTAFGSPSQANLRRLGFTIEHTRTLWRPLTQ